MRPQHRKPQRDGWATAQEPSFITGDTYGTGSASPQQKRRDAETMQADLQAYMDKGGKVEVLPTVSSGRKARGRK